MDKKIIKLQNQRKKILSKNYETKYEFEKANQKLNEIVPCKTGVFGAEMKVNILNDGPVTIIIDSKDK